MLSSTFWSRVAIALACFALLFVSALAVAIAFGTSKPQPPIARRQLDLTGLPALSWYTARDGARLAYRHYPGGEDEVVVLIHGTATESSVMNALAKKLNATGASVYAPDLRGHGSSGKRGDIDYIGQLEDDLADLVAKVHSSHPHAKLTLIGFSGGAAFVIRIAGGATGQNFDRYIVIDPAIVYPSPIARPNSGGWATPFLPRIVALLILDRLGIHSFDGLDTIVFAIPPGNPNLAGHYTFRLMMNLNSADYFAELQRTKKPMTLVAGAADEQFYADRYAPAMKPAKPDLQVVMVPGMDHVDMIMKPAALDAEQRVFVAMTREHKAK